MTHITVIQEGQNLADRFPLEPCNGCEAGCNSGFESFHCPICPKTKLKPTRKPKVLEHIRLHFFGAKGNVHMKGYHITGCYQICPGLSTAVTSSNRLHFHCPFCNKTFGKKSVFIKHVDECDNLLSEVLRLISDDNSRNPLASASLTSATLDPTSGIIHNDPKPMTDPERNAFPQQGAVDLPQTMPSAAAPPISTNSVECQSCHKRYHKKYIRQHMRDVHESKETVISKGRHHHSVVVDVENGIYAVARTIKGPEYPVHVVKKTMGTDAHVECEVDDCQDICQTEWRSGNAGFLCDHLKSTEFCAVGSPCDLSQEKLKEMVSSGFMTEARRNTCQSLVNTANSDHVPALVFLPHPIHCSDRFKFYSIYTGTTRWWCNMKRTVVSIDTKKSSLACHCKRKSCGHRGLVKWWLFQQGTDTESMMETDDGLAETDERMSTRTYPPTGQMLKTVLEYMMAYKTIPDEQLPNFSKELCPKQLIPSETECESCGSELGSPQLITRRAKVIDLVHEPIPEYETFYRECGTCKMPYRYQESKDGLFNYDDHLLLSYELLMEIRAGLVTHTAINRVVKMLEYRIRIKLNHQDVEHAYLSFEALVQHGYDFFCIRCGHHPKILIHDLTKKAVFRYAVDDVPIPQNPVSEVDADEFWKNILQEVLARGFLKGAPNPFKVKPSYQKWSPYIGPFTRKTRFLVNTEHEKLKPTDTQDHEAVPEEILTHLLANEKKDVVSRFCRILGIQAEGSKLDMLCRLRAQSVSKAKFNHAYCKVLSISGGWLSSSCTHNVTYAIKFLLRSESPRDYIDILRSMKHQPTINIADIANTIARLGNRIQPGLFHPNEGRVTEDTENNQKSAREGTLNISMPFLSDDRPKATTDPAVHPITGTDEKYMLFDWFHQDNCQIPAEFLRRSTLVKELAGHINTQAAEQIHRDKERDVYWLNEMAPTNHIFTFRLVTHLQNAMRNEETVRKQMKVIPELKLNSLGQLVKKTTASDLQYQIATTVPISLPNQDHSYSQPCPDPSQPTLEQSQPTSEQSQPTPAQCRPTTIQSSMSYSVCGVTYNRQCVYGDGNCLFRSVGVVVPGWAEQDHLALRNQAFEWCRSNRTSLDISNQELADLEAPGTSVGDFALTGLANVLQVGFMVVFETRTGQQQQIFQPRSGNSVADLFVLFFSMHPSGHYDALLPVAGCGLRKTSASERAFHAARKQGNNNPNKGKRKRVGTLSFKDLPLRTRQEKMFEWIGLEDEMESAMEGQLVEEDKVEIRPQCISSCILEDQVNLQDIRPFLSDDAWICFMQTIREKQKIQTWICHVCNINIAEGETSIMCDHCLRWMHLKCAGLKRVPKKEKWICSQCS